MTEARGHAVITGIAASTWLGTGIEPLFQAFAEGLYARRPSAESPSQSHPGGAEPAPLGFRPVTLDASHLLRKTRTDDRLAIQLLKAIEADLSGAISKLGDAERAQTSVVLGNTSGCVDAYLRFYAKGTREGPRAVNPVDFPTTLPNYQAVQVSSAFSLAGANATLGSGLSAGLDAVGYAAARLASGKERFSLAGGAEASNEVNRTLLPRSELLVYAGLPRPLREDRRGTVLAEGVGILYLERRSSRERQGGGLGAILGYASAAGAADAGSDDLRRRGVDTLTHALRGSGLGAADVDAVFPSANGSRRGDALELDILREVFGRRLRTLPIYPAKAVFGECLTASGPLQCIAALSAMHHGRASARGRSLRAVGKGDGVRLADRFERCECALVYTVGVDHTVSALVIGKP